MHILDDDPLIIVEHRDLIIASLFFFLIFSDLSAFVVVCFCWFILQQKPKYEKSFRACMFAATIEFTHIPVWSLFYLGSIFLR